MCVFVLSRVFVYLWVFICLGNVGLCWPELVPNQRQLFIVVSDWGSYLGCHFHFGFVGYSLCTVACQHSFYIASRSFC
jgi:hypothetical protein